MNTCLKYSQYRLDLIRKQDILLDLQLEQKMPFSERIDPCSSFGMK